MSRANEQTKDDLYRNQMRRESRRVWLSRVLQVVLGTISLLAIVIAVQFHIESGGPYSLFTVDYRVFDDGTDTCVILFPIVLLLLILWTAGKSPGKFVPPAFRASKIWTRAFVALLTPYFSLSRGNDAIRHVWIKTNDPSIAGLRRHWIRRHMIVTPLEILWVAFIVGILSSILTPVHSEMLR